MRSLGAALALLLAATCPAAEMVVRNASFEAGSAGAVSEWTWWSRTSAGSATRCDARAHEGSHAARIEHDGERDWAFTSSSRFAVQPGEGYAVTAWALVERGHVELAAVGYGGGELVSWNIGSSRRGASEDWVELRALVEVPEGVDSMGVRFVGAEDTLAWVDAVAVSEHEWLAPADLPPVEGWAEERVREALDRGLIARPLEEGSVYLGWRLLDDDPDDVAFHVYRRHGDAAPSRLTDEPLRETTDFVDGTATAGREYAWFVRTVADGEEGPPSPAATATPGDGALPYVSIPLRGDYTFQKVAIADLTGDGRYDFVIKQPNRNVDPWHLYWKPSPGTYTLEAYTADGEFLWELDLGWSIEQGVWYSPYIAFDFTGNGRAEVAVKTGEGDPRDEDGRVQEGPEYLTLLDGLSGEVIDRVDWPARDDFEDYNRASRNQIAVAYLDGRTPCLIAQRGTYGFKKAVAYQVRDGRLEELWSWDNRDLPRRFWGQGAHTVKVADVDGDGRDEVILGSMVLDDNGVPLWTTGLGHPDHVYVGNLDPARPGLEIYFGMETRQERNGMCMVDAATGEILWGFDEPTVHIHHAGLVSPIDPRRAGSECYSGERDFPEKRWLFDARGELIEMVDLGGLAPRAAWWDADPTRELLARGRIHKYHPPHEYPTRIEGHIAAVADLFGDWREEIVTSVPGEIRIYTTTIPARDRRTTLMQDPLYRLDVAIASMGYFQVPLPSYDPLSPGPVGGESDGYRE